MATTGSPRWPAALAGGSTCGHRRLGPRAARLRTRRAARQGRRDQRWNSGLTTRDARVRRHALATSRLRSTFRGGVADRHHDGFSTSDTASPPLHREPTRPDADADADVPWVVRRDSARSNATSGCQQRIGPKHCVFVIAGQQVIGALLAFPRAKRSSGGGADGDSAVTAGRLRSRGRDGRTESNSGGTNRDCASVEVDVRPSQTEHLAPTHSDFVAGAPTGHSRGMPERGRHEGFGPS